MNSVALYNALKVYLVEDSALIRPRLLKMLGTIGGVEVVGTSEDSTSALSDLPIFDADVIIIDVEWIDGSGLRLLERLSKTRSGAIPIILMNAVLQEFRTVCLAAGASFVFDKAIELAHVRDTVRQLVEKKREKWP
jgi:two-component system response regulator DevR